MVQEPIPSASFVRFASELEVSKAPNTTLSAMLMIYLFLTLRFVLSCGEDGRGHIVSLTYKEFISYNDAKMRIIL